MPIDKYKKKHRVSFVFTNTNTYQTCKMTQEQRVACYLRELSALYLSIASELEGYGHVSHDVVKLRTLLQISEQLRTAHLHLITSRYQDAQRVIERVRLEITNFNKGISVG